MRIQCGIDEEFVVGDGFGPFAGIEVRGELGHLVHLDGGEFEFTCHRHVFLEVVPHGLKHFFAVRVDHFGGSTIEAFAAGVFQFRNNDTAAPVGPCIVVPSRLSGALEPLFFEQAVVFFHVAGSGSVYPIQELAAHFMDVTRGIP
ncbi:hypothetical protein SDC9_198407 [bioreactor metagenome]|uniref:Uncharacterized protein n=1 Tax=bioreactor metagenome TaxID=1076179 RepID=A0A645IQZ9_9ZZZZ